MSDNAGKTIRLRAVLSVETPPAEQMAAAGRTAGKVYGNAFRGAAEPELRQVQKMLNLVERAGLTPSQVGPTFSRGVTDLAHVAAARTRPQILPTQGGQQPVVRAGQASIWTSISASIDRITGGSLAKFVSALSGVGGVVGKVLSPITNGFGAITGAVGTAARAVAGLPRAFLGLAAVTYSLTTVGHAIETFLVTPVMNFGKFALSATEDARKFVYAMSSALGSVGKGWQLDEQLLAVSRRGTSTLREYREAATALASLPSLSGQLVWSKDAEGAASAVKAFDRLGQQLKSLDPSQAAGSLVALRNLWEGGGESAFISLKRRFGISSQSLGRAIAKDLQTNVADAVSRIQADPQLATKALGRYLDQLIPPETTERMGRLISVRLAHLQDVASSAVVRISEGGLFDSISDKVQSFTDELYGLVSSAKFADGADRLGKALGRILDNIGGAIGSFVDRLAGGTGEATKSVSGFFNGLVDLVEKASSLSDVLPALGTAAADVLGRIGPMIRDFAGSIADLVGELKGLRSGGLRGLLLGTGDTAPALPGPIGAVASMFGAAGGRVAPAGTGATRADLFGSWPTTRPTIPDITRVNPDAADRLPASVRRALRDEDGGPPWDQRLMNLSAALGRLPGPADEGDALSKLVKSARGLTTLDLAGDARSPVTMDKVFARMAEDQKRFFDKLDATIGEGRAALSAGSNPELSKAIGRLSETKDASAGRYKLAVEAVRDHLVDSAKDFAVALGEGLDKLPAFAQAEMRQRIATGSTTFANKIADVLDAAGMPLDRAAIGFKGMSVRQQQAFASADVESKIQGVQDAGRYGNLKIGMDSNAVKDAFAERLEDAQVSAGQIGVLRESIDRQGQILERALADYRKNPDELSVGNLGNAEAELGKLLARLDELKLKTDTASQAFRDFAESARQSVESSLGNALASVITRTGDLKSVFRDLANSLVQSWTQAMAKMALQGLVGDLGKTQQNGSTGGPGGLFGAAFGAAFGGGTTGGTVKAAAQGAVFDGGLRFLAAGGIVSKPTWAVVGERQDRVPEGVIPLLGPGHSIPLGLDGGGLHAKLPGGRRISASFYADGGILGGSAMTYAGGSGSPGGGSLGGELPLAGSAGAVDAVGQQESQERQLGIFVVANSEEAVRRGMRKNSDLLIDTVVGDVRGGRRLAKSIKRMSRS